MSRVARALKRERERSSANSRQELEQLRLEFLAREERYVSRLTPHHPCLFHFISTPRAFRYVLDGDREELRGIRKELQAFRAAPPGAGARSRL